MITIRSLTTLASGLALALGLGVAQAQSDVSPSTTQDQTNLDGTRQMEPQDPAAIQPAPESEQQLSQAEQQALPDAAQAPESQWPTADPSLTQSPEEQQQAQAGQEQDVAAAPTTQPPGATTTGQTPQVTMGVSPDLLQGRQVTNADGTTLGQVSEVVRDRRSGEIRLVINPQQPASGQQPATQSQLALPADQLTLQQNQLKANRQISQNELQQFSYQPGQYEPVASQRTAEAPIEEPSPPLENPAG